MNPPKAESPNVIIQLPLLRWLWTIPATVAVLLTVEGIIFGRLVKPTVTLIQTTQPPPALSLPDLQQELQETQSQLAAAKKELSQLQWARLAVSANTTFLYNGRRYWRLPAASTEVTNFQFADEKKEIPAVALTPDPKSQ